MALEIVPKIKIQPLSVMGFKRKALLIDRNSILKAVHLNHGPTRGCFVVMYREGKLRKRAFTCDLPPQARCVLVSEAEFESFRWAYLKTKFPFLNFRLMTVVVILALALIFKFGLLILTFALSSK